MLGFLPKSKFITDLKSFLDSLKKTPKAPTSQELAHAIHKKHLFLVFQPKQDLQQGTITGVEALVRWKDPERGVLYPDSFIPLAEQSGLIIPLTWCVIQLAFAQQAEWRAQGWDLNIAINIPAAFIKSEGMLEAFDQLAQQSHAVLHNITLELTESVGVECLGYARHVLEALHKRGCKLSLDDFGTGYSSMIQLYRLPFSELKIDRSFVSLIEQDNAARAITLSIIELGKRLGLTVVAEGIETAAQCAMLVEAGCSVGQGYFITRPLTADTFTTWLSEQSSTQLIAHEQSMLSSCKAC